MQDEQTNTTDTKGEEISGDIEDDKKPVSLYDKTEAMVTRQEAANKKAEELLDRQEKLYANQRLAGTTGGNVKVETKEETPKEYADKVMAGKSK